MPSDFLNKALVNFEVQMGLRNFYGIHYSENLEIMCLGISTFL